MDDWHKSHRQNKPQILASTLQLLRERLGAEAIQTLDAVSFRAVSYIPFGIPELPAAFGEGFPRGRVSEIVGAPTSGVTTFLLRCTAALLDAGWSAIIIDLAHALAPDYTARCGVDLKSLPLVRPARPADALDIAGDLVISESIDLLVIASGPTPVVTPVGGMQKLAVRVANSTAALVILTSIAEKPSTDKSYVSYRLKVERVRWQWARHNLLGWESRITVVKNKLGVAGGSTTFRVVLPEPPG